MATAHAHQQIRENKLIRGTNTPFHYNFAHCERCAAALRICMLNYGAPGCQFESLDSLNSLNTPEMEYSRHTAPTRQVRKAIGR